MKNKSRVSRVLASVLSAAMLFTSVPSEFLAADNADVFAEVTASEIIEPAETPGSAGDAETTETAETVPVNADAAPDENTEESPDRNAAPDENTEELSDRNAASADDPDGTREGDPVEDSAEIMEELVEDADDPDDPEELIPEDPQTGAEEDLIVDMESEAAAEPAGSGEDLVYSDDLSGTANFDGLPDGDTLFAGYVNEQFYGDAEGAGPEFGDPETVAETAGILAEESSSAYLSLDPNSMVLYQKLYAAIGKIAGGTEESTSIQISISDFHLYSNYYTAEDLEVEKLVENGKITDEAYSAMLRMISLDSEHIGQVLRLILARCPYELYWFDKTEGIKYGAGIRGNSEALSFVEEEPAVLINLPVSEDYRGTSELTVDRAKTGAASMAASNAMEVITSYAAYSDLEKLQAYKNYITVQVSYNDEAADDETHTPYGDPWQLIWVFDGIAETNVVCEGYSKAFKYLCDQTDFANRSIGCYLATGIMSAPDQSSAGVARSGRHMWNLVSINNITYLADITNSDSGTIGEEGWLFLAGAFDYDEAGYLFCADRENPEAMTVSYRYDPGMPDLYDSRFLDISFRSYSEVQDSASHIRSIAATAPATSMIGSEFEGIQITMTYIDGDPETFTNSGYDTCCDRYGNQIRLSCEELDEGEWKDRLGDHQVRITCEDFVETVTIHVVPRLTRKQDYEVLSLPSAGGSFPISFDEYNEFGEYISSRYFCLEVAQAGKYRFAASHLGGELYDEQEKFLGSFWEGSDPADIFLTAGDYLLELYRYDGNEGTVEVVRRPDLTDITLEDGDGIYKGTSFEEWVQGQKATLVFDGNITGDTDRMTGALTDYYDGSSLAVRVENEDTGEIITTDYLQNWQEIPAGHYLVTVSCGSISAQRQVWILTQNELYLSQASPLKPGFNTVPYLEGCPDQFLAFTAQEPGYYLVEDEDCGVRSQLEGSPWDVPVYLAEGDSFVTSVQAGWNDIQRDGTVYVHQLSLAAEGSDSPNTILSDENDKYLVFIPGQDGFYHINAAHADGSVQMVRGDSETVWLTQISGYVDDMNPGEESVVYLKEGAVCLLEFWRRWGYNDDYENPPEPTVTIVRDSVASPVGEASVTLLKNSWMAEADYPTAYDVQVSYQVEQGGEVVSCTLSGAETDVCGNRILDVFLEDEYGNRVYDEPDQAGDYRVCVVFGDLLCQDVTFTPFDQTAIPEYTPGTWSDTLFPGQKKLYAAELEEAVYALDGGDFNLQFLTWNEEEERLEPDEEAQEAFSGNGTVSEGSYLIRVRNDSAAAGSFNLHKYEPIPEELAVSYVLGERIDLKSNSTGYYSFTLYEETILGLAAESANNVKAWIIPYGQSGLPEQAVEVRNNAVTQLESGTYILCVENNKAAGFSCELYAAGRIWEDTTELTGLTKAERFFLFEPVLAEGTRASYTFTTYDEVGGFVYDETGKYMALISSGRPQTLKLEAGKQYRFWLRTDSSDATAGGISISKKLLPSNVVVRLPAAPYLFGINSPSVDDFTVEYDCFNEDGNQMHVALYGDAQDENGYGLTGLAFYTDEARTRPAAAFEEPDTYYYRVMFAGDEYTGEVRIADPMEELDVLPEGSAVEVKQTEPAWYLFTAEEDKSYYYNYTYYFPEDEYKDTSGTGFVNVGLFEPGSMEPVGYLKKGRGTDIPAGTYILKIENHGDYKLNVTVRAVIPLRTGQTFLDGGLAEAPCSFRTDSVPDAHAWYVVRVSSGYHVTIEDREERIAGTVYAETDTLLPLTPDASYTLIFHKNLTGVPDSFSVTITQYTPPRQVSLREVPDLAEHFETLSVSDLVLDYEDADGNACSISPGQINESDTFLVVADAWFADNEDEDALGTQLLEEAGSYTAYVQFFDGLYSVPVNVVPVEEREITGQGAFAVTSVSPDAPDRFVMRMTDGEEYLAFGSESGVRLRPAGGKKGEESGSLTKEKTGPFYFSAYRENDSGTGSGGDSGSGSGRNAGGCSGADSGSAGESAEAYVYVRHKQEKLTISTDETEFYWTGSDLEPAVSLLDRSGSEVDPSLYTVAFRDAASETGYAGMVEPGDYVVTANGLRQYTGLSDWKYLTVTPFPLSSGEISVSTSGAEHTYDSESFLPDVTVTRSGENLDEEDFELSWRSADHSLSGSFAGGPAKAGSYLVVVNGTENGHYTGERTIPFAILPRDISQEASAGEAAVSAALSETEFYYDPDEPARPQVTLIFRTGDPGEEDYREEKLMEGRDYTLEWNGGDRIGDAGVTVLGKGNYTGTVSLPFTVLDPKIPVETMHSAAYAPAVFTGSSTLPAGQQDVWYRFAADGETMLLVSLPLADPDDILFYRWDGTGEYYEIDRTVVPAETGKATYALLFDEGELALCVPAGISAGFQISMPASDGEPKDLVYVSGDAPEQMYRLDAEKNYRYVFASDRRFAVTPVSRRAESLGQRDGSEMTAREADGTYYVKTDLTAGSCYFYVRPLAQTQGTFTLGESELPEKIGGVTAEAAVLQIGVNWSIANDRDTDYRVYRKVGDGEFALAAQIDDFETNSWVDTEVSPDLEYTYYVAGVYGPYVEGPGSDESGPVRPLSDTKAPVITSLTASGEGTRFKGTVTFTARAVDEIGVTAMRLLIREKGAGDDAWRELASSESGTVQAAVDTTAEDYRQYADYEVRAVAEDAAGNVSDPSIKTFTFDNQGPSQVYGLEALETQPVYVTLKWSDVPEELERNKDRSGFRVEQQAADGSWVFVGNTTSHNGMTIRSLIPDTAYTWHVAAFDDLGNLGEYSQPLTITLPADTTPPSITNHSVTPSHTGYRYNGTVTYTVTGDDQANGYGLKKLRIEYSRDGNTWTALKEESCDQPVQRKTMSAELDTGTLEEGKWLLRGVAEDWYENVGEGATQDIIVDRTAPAAPTGVYLYAGENQYGAYIEVSWDQGKESDLSGYEVWRSADGEDFDRIAPGLQTVSYNDYGVQANETWYYRVRAVDTAGNVSGPSQTVSAEVVQDETPPVMYSLSPAEDSRLSGMKGSVGVSAAAYDNRALAAVIFFSKTDAAADYVQFARITLEKKDSGVLYASLSTEGLTDGQKVYVKAQAVDREGNTSEPLETSFILDMAAPQVLSASAALNEEDRTVAVNWTGGGEEDLYGYYLYRYEGESSTLVSTIPASAAGLNNSYSWTDTRVAPLAGQFRYTLAAFDRVGNLSEEVTAGTVTLPGLQEDDPILLVLPRPVINCDNLMQKDVQYDFGFDNLEPGAGIVTCLWKFGDGTTSEDEKPRHSYHTTGNYTVTLTVADQDGHEVTAAKDITVREKSTLGSVKITVKDYEDRRVANAPVYFDLGTDAQFIRYTDQNGEVIITSRAGTHPVGCFKDHYLPVSKDILVVSGQTGEYELLIKEEEIVTGEFEIHRMNLEEIVEAGININDPANQHVAEITVHLEYHKQEVDIPILFNSTGIINWEPFHVDFGDGVRSFIPGIIWGGSSGGVSGTGGGGTGGGGTGWGWGLGGDDDDVTVALLEIPVGVSALKEFFNVKLHILNHAGSEFSLIDNTVTLNVPEGLTIMKANNTLDTATVHIDRIAGQTTETLEWILRGDEVGEYYLNADYAGTLAMFNAMVQARFVADDPIQVYGLSGCRLTVTIPNTISAGGFGSNDAALYYDLRLENEGSVPVYLPTLTPREGDAFSSLMYNGHDVDDFPQQLNPGEFLEIYCRMNVDKRFALYELYDYYYTMYGNTGLQVEVVTEDNPLFDNSVVFTAAGTGQLLKDTQVFVNNTEYRTDAEGVLYLVGSEIDEYTFRVTGYYDYTVDAEKLLGETGSHKVVMRVRDD